LRHVRVGYNFRLSELHAALGLAQLERIDSILASRADVARRYSDILSRQPQLQLLETDSRTTRSWFVYIVRFRAAASSALRDRVRDSLRDKGIGSQIYFTPIHHQPFYQKCQSENIPHLPYTDQAAKECLAIPFHSKLSDAEIQYVCDAIQQALEPPNQEPATLRETAQLVSTQVMET
jgi:perosamine synthetase